MVFQQMFRPHGLAHTASPAWFLRTLLASSPPSTPGVNRAVTLIYLHCILLTQESLSTGSLPLGTMVGCLGPGLQTQVPTGPGREHQQ